MKIYLAARYDRREEIAQKAEYARAHGFEVTSSWLEPSTLPDPDSVEEMSWWGKEAERDIQEIHASNALVMFAEEPGALYPRGGRHVEFGYALGIGRQLIVIGESENIFQSLRNVHQYETFEEFIDVYKPARLQRFNTYSTMKATQDMHSNLQSMQDTLLNILERTK